MIDLKIILWILFAHWIADFIFQTHEESINKSKSNYWLSLHVIKYSNIVTLLWFPFIIFYSNIKAGKEFSYMISYALLIMLITFITHWITDYFTSRWTSKLYTKGDIHNFFVVVGLDQFIHFTTLFLTYKILFTS